MPVSEPFEILELADGQSVRLKVVNYEFGEAVIHPRYTGSPAEKRIPVLRLYVPADYKPRGPPYWDVTSKTLQAQLKPLLDMLKASGREVVVTAHGVAPSKRFTLRVE
jgi:hypothetical protein